MKLSKFEKKIVKDFEEGKYKEVGRNLEEYRQAARNTKDRINLRIDPEVRDKFWEKSIEEGIPYQTLINSVLKKYINGNLIESSIVDIVNELKSEIRNLKKKT